MQQHHIPEFYGDGWGVNLTKYSASITIGEVPEPKTFAPKATIRMPLSQVKELAMYLRQAIKAYERQDGVIVSVRKELMNNWGIALEDW